MKLAYKIYKIYTLCSMEPKSQVKLQEWVAVGVRNSFLMIRMFNVNLLNVRSQEFKDMLPKRKLKGKIQISCHNVFIFDRHCTIIILQKRTQIYQKSRYENELCLKLEDITNCNCYHPLILKCKNLSQNPEKYVFLLSQQYYTQYIYHFACI